MKGGGGEGGDKQTAKNSFISFQTVRKKRRRSDITVPIFVDDDDKSQFLPLNLIPFLSLSQLHNGHHFNLDYVHIPTYCEICNVVSAVVVVA